MKAGLWTHVKPIIQNNFNVGSGRVCFYITGKGEDFVSEKILEAE